MVVMEEDMVAEEKENLKTGEENSVGNEASPGLRSRSRVSKVKWLQLFLFVFVA